MSQITLTDLDRFGYRLLADEENYLQELVDRELEISGGIGAAISPEIIELIGFKTPPKFDFHDGFPIPQ